jgi:hypothetical protein
MRAGGLWQMLVARSGTTRDVISILERAAGKFVSVLLLVILVLMCSRFKTGRCLWNVQVVCIELLLHAAAAVSLMFDVSQSSFSTADASVACASSRTTSHAVE